MEQTLGSTVQAAKTLLAGFDKIYIHQNSRFSEVGLRIASLAQGARPIEYVESPPWENHRGTMSSQQYEDSKRKLFITPFSGQFFKRCPGSAQKKALTCCNYHVLNLGSQCHMNCSYCYLQSYLNTPATQIFSNIDQAIQELSEMAELHPEAPFRIGTGEVIDSLGLDPLTLYSQKLISFFLKYPKWSLEFKTKSSSVDQFLECPHGGNVMVGWSINCEEVIASEESGTASLQERFCAARKCLDHGFKVNFHLDPLIWFPEWQVAYGRLLDQIHELFRPEEIGVISMGALRFQPEQRHMMRERYGMSSKVMGGEMFPSEGNKLRYDRELRNQMFRFVRGRLLELSPGWRTYLCMETPESWISTYQQLPTRQEELKEIFRPLPVVR